MKKIGKKLSAILFVALCCVLLFPITAMAVEPAIMPDENELTVRFYLDGMNPTPPKSEPIYLKHKVMKTVIFPSTIHRCNFKVNTSATIFLVCT